MEKSPVKIDKFKDSMDVCWSSFWNLKKWQVTCENKSIFKFQKGQVARENKLVYWISKVGHVTHDNETIFFFG